MNDTGTGAGLESTRDIIAAVYRSESRRVLATLIRLLGDFDTAEEALQQAFAAALEQWPQQGVPANPRTWLVSAGRFKGIDGIRRNARWRAAQEQIAYQSDLQADERSSQDDELLEDDRLRLIYLVFNEGYTASSGATLTRHDLSGEAIRLGRLLLELLPEPEVMGLQALMLLHESRRAVPFD